MKTVPKNTWKDKQKNARPTKVHNDKPLRQKKAEDFEQYMERYLRENTNFYEDLEDE